MEGTCGADEAHGGRWGEPAGPTGGTKDADVRTCRADGGCQWADGGTSGVVVAAKSYCCAVAGLITEDTS